MQQNINKAHLRSLSKQSIIDLLSDLDNTVMLMKNKNYTTEDIENSINKEIDSIQPFFKTDEPFNEKSEEPDFSYSQSIIKFDKLRLKTFIADIYNCNNKNFSGIIIKSDFATLLAKKNLKTNRLTINTTYNNADSVSSIL